MSITQSQCIVTSRHVVRSAVTLFVPCWVSKTTYPLEPSWISIQRIIFCCFAVGPVAALRFTIRPSIVPACLAGDGTRYHMEEPTITWPSITLKDARRFVIVNRFNRCSVLRQEACPDPVCLSVQVPWRFRVHFSYIRRLLTVRIDINA
jgi:hypothetical protein